MSSADRLPLWWDREIDDETGARLRPDVREAGHKVWKLVCARSREILGDEADAAEVLEACVRTISRYLDKRGVSLNSADPSGLLILAAYRSFRRVAKKRNRIEFLGPTTELAEMLRAPSWGNRVDRELFLDELARELNNKTRGTLRLRMADYDWKEIGRMLRMTPTAARTAFWRDVRRAHLRLLEARHLKGPEK